MFLLVIRYLITTLARTKKFLLKALLMFVRVITILQLQLKKKVTLIVSFILECTKQAAYFVNIFFPPIQTLNAWKFPGGLSNPGEDIGKS